MSIHGHQVASELQPAWRCDLLAAQAFAARAKDAPSSTLVLRTKLTSVNLPHINAGTAHTRLLSSMPDGATRGLHLLWQHPVEVQAISHPCCVAVASRALQAGPQGSCAAGVHVLQNSFRTSAGTCRAVLDKLASHARVPQPWKLLNSMLNSHLHGTWPVFLR